MNKNKVYNWIFICFLHLTKINPIVSLYNRREAEVDNSLRGDANFDCYPPRQKLYILLVIHQFYNDTCLVESDYYLDMYITLHCIYQGSPDLFVFINQKQRFYNRCEPRNSWIFKRTNE